MPIHHEPRKDRRPRRVGRQRKKILAVGGESEDVPPSLSVGYSSGQRGQTVNLLGSALHWFESSSYHHPSPQRSGGEGCPPSLQRRTAPLPRPAPAPDGAATTQPSPALHPAPAPDYTATTRVRMESPDRAQRFGHGALRAAHRHPRTTGEKIRYGEPKGLAAELLRGCHINCLRRGIGIHGLGESSGRTHPVAAIPLRLARHVAVEARHARHDNLMSIRLVHAVTHAAAKGPAKQDDPSQEVMNSDLRLLVVWRQS